MERCDNCGHMILSSATFRDGKHRDATCEACHTFHQWDEPGTSGRMVGLVPCECPRRKEDARTPRFS